jgi:nucleoid-associated protein YgaU
MGRLILLSFFCVAVLVACGGGGEEVLPTAVPPADATAAPDSPRITETPDPGLPPTWTPVPAGDRGHLPGAAAPGDESGEGGTSIIVTGTPFIYIVQAGDTLAEIAAEYGVTVSDLAALNNIDNIDRIEVGQELIIPLAGE